MRAGLKFESCAKAYRLISDDTVPVVVATWKEHATEIEGLLNALRIKQNRANFRALSPFQVNVFRSALKLLPAGLAVPLAQESDFHLWYGGYHTEIGLIYERDNDDLII